MFLSVALAEVPEMNAALLDAGPAAQFYTCYRPTLLSSVPGNCYKQLRDLEKTHPYNLRFCLT